MGSDVDQRTAALLVLVKEHTPGRNAAATNCGSLTEIDIAERAVLSLLLEVESVGGLTVLITDRELLSAAFSCVEHLLSLGGVDSHRLLAHYVLACLESGNGDRAVHSVRCADMYNVDALVLKELSVILVDLCIGGAVLLLSSLGSLNDDIAECYHFCVGLCSERGHMLAVCDSAASDNSDSELLSHFGTSFLYAWHTQ